jgi:hypothetical protein
METEYYAFKTNYKETTIKIEKDCVTTVKMSQTLRSRTSSRNSPSSWDGSGTMFAS